MKKILLTLLTAFIGLTAMAQNTKTYTDSLRVQINDQVSNPMEASINVEQAEDGTYTFSLIDFRLKDETSDLGIGNIILKGVTVKEEKGLKTFTTQQEITITPGSTGEPGDWLGPMLGVVPIDMKGEMTEDQMHCSIDIDMSATLKQIIKVNFGKEIVVAPAHDYTFTDTLTVQINDQVSNPMEATIFADKAEDGTYTFSLIDFRLKDETSDLGIGNIILKGVTVKEENGVKTFTTQQKINITPGSTGEPGDWLGPMLGVVPIDMKGEMTENQMHCTIDIDMSATLKQIIKVNFGKEIEVAPAHDYTFTDQLTVQINDQVSNPMQATIFADKAEDGTYTFSLIDFRLKDETSDLGIGNIILKGVTVKEENGVKTFTTQQKINITPGSTGEPGDWLGPMLGVVPIDMKGEMTENQMHCTIDIDMSATLKQIIKVNFGKEIEVAPAHDYTFTDQLTVQINDQVSNPMQATIFADKAEDGTYTFSLIDFRLKDETSDLGIGNIILKGVTVKEENGVKTFATKQNINITPGSTGEPGDWLGPMLGVVPIDMKGEMTEDKMYCTIDIDMSATLKQIIKVNFGKTITGIENTIVNNGLVNVYNVNGTIVRSQVNAANALKNLPRGLYIVNGKKCFNK